MSAAVLRTPAADGVRGAWQAGAVRTTTRPAGLLGRWSDPEKVDAYTRGSLYVASAAEPVVLLVVVAQRPVEAAWAVPGAVLVLAHMVACMLVLRAGLARSAAAPGPSRALVATTVALAVGAGVVLVGTGGWVGDGVRVDPRVGVVLVLATATLGALAPRVRARDLLLVLGAVVAAALAVQVVVGGADAGEVLRTAFVTLSVVAVLLSYRVSAWMVDVVWELERARVTQAQLAVAEERLRFSRDLHDVVGRALTAVAVKSELAAELASRGRDGAGGHMLEVRDLAHDTLREVRAVVEGYRAADLGAELVGARSVLRSAGVEVRVAGEDVAGRLGRAAAEALGWVVREGVTNVVRHADARTCELTLATTGDAAVLRIANDGVRARTSDGGGAGLRGLAERLVPLGGHVTTTAGDDRFVLEARVPVTAEVAA